MKTITKHPLGKNGPLVSEIGLGCMRMSPSFGSKGKDEAECIATIHAALDSGINFINTADFYGSGHNELLIGKAVKGRRDEAFLSVKFGALLTTGGGFAGLDMRPAAIRNFISYSLVRLGVDTIDLYQPCRPDPHVPVEDVAGAIADLIKEGKVRYFGLSEVSAEELRKAHAVHPVTAVEAEYALGKRSIETSLLPTARELGIGIVAYGMTTQGLLTGNVKAPLAPQDPRNRLPRYQPENLAKNLEKVDVLITMAKEKGYTPAQLAIAWVHQQGADILPLVGMSQRARIPENTAALEITFTEKELQQLDTTFAIGAIAGESFAAHK